MAFLFLLACGVGLYASRPQAAAAPAAAPSAVIGRGAALDFDGDRAYQHDRALVEIGPRSCGSPGHEKAVDYIVHTLQGYGCKPEKLSFNAATPDGTVRMTNIVAVIGPPLERAEPSPMTAQGTPLDADTVVLAAHYDTKRFPFTFVGANDGGSGTAALLEMARVFMARPPRLRVVLVFFDGEEAFHEWAGSDNTYGSRQLAADWQGKGFLPHIKAFILMDMIGYSELAFMRDANSNSWLQNRIWQQAAAQNRGRYFTDEQMSIEDDHIPFVTRGVPAAVLIDFQYGPNGTNTYWHTAQDTLDKISSKSLGIVGRIIEGVTREF